MSIIEEFNEIATSLSNRYVDDWKKEGKKVVGYTCSYIPEEIISAAGLLPFRMRGVGAASTTIADIYYGPVNCSFPKCLLQLVGEDKYRFLDGAVIMPGCDSMRRLDEGWRHAAEDSNGSFPDYHYFFGVPHKVTPYGLTWFVTETRNFAASLERHFGVSITESDLKDAIQEYNEGRDLLAELDGLRFREAVPISGADATAVIIASCAMPRKAFNDLLRAAR